MSTWERKVPKRPESDDWDPAELLKAEAKAIVQEELGLAATASAGLLLVVALFVDLDR